MKKQPRKNQVIAVRLNTNGSIDSMIDEALKNMEEITGKTLEAIFAEYEKLPQRDPKTMRL